jgi:hypothetical protein
MYRLTVLSLKQRSVVILATIHVALMVVYGMTQLKSEFLPDINIPVLTVITTYQGADPNAVDTTVSQPFAARSMKNTIDRLDGAGLIARTAHPTDRRVSLVVLTEQGREMALTIQRERKEHISEVFGHLSDDDIDNFARLLQTTLERVDTGTDSHAAPSYLMGRLNLK